MGFEWLNEGKTLKLKIISDNKFNIEINVGYFPERVEFWKVNDTEIVDFHDNQFTNDQPLYTMYEFIKSNRFSYKLIEQSWLTNEVIRVLAS